jgi:hypothetical protein
VIDKDATSGVISAFLVTFAGILSVVMVILKRSSNARVDALRNQMNGLGKRVNEHDTKIAKNESAASDFRGFRESSESDRSRLWTARGEDRAEIGGIKAMIVTQHQDIMEAIRESATKQMEAVHQVELQVARAAAKQDVVGVLSEQLGRIAEIMERRERNQGD